LLITIDQSKPQMKKIILGLILTCLQLLLAGQSARANTITDTVKYFPAQVIAIHTVHLNESQANDIDKIEKSIGADSAKNICIAYPGNVLRFKITNPSTFLNDRPKDQARVVIYVNGVELRGICTSWESALTSQLLKTNKDIRLGSTADINIELKRNDTTQAAWNFIYNNKRSFWDSNADVDASIGWEGMSPLDKVGQAKNENVKVVFYQRWVLIPWVILFVILFLGFIGLAGWTNTMKEGGDGGAYSLSLTQLMFWTIIVIGGFIYILLLTDTPTGFNSSILLMLGISISTTGAASFIDSRFKQQAVFKPTSNHFFKDILTSDGSSYSVQRIQSFAWNLVLGLYFIGYTIAKKTMPEFSSTLLFLAGISSASYVGTKVPEGNDLKQQQQQQQSNSLGQIPSGQPASPEGNEPTTPPATAVG